MTAGGHSDYPRLAWATACGLALAVLALLSFVFPEWKTAARGPRPAVPRFVLASFGKESTPETRELRIGRSPTLIALEHSLAIPGGAARQANWVRPPPDAPPMSPVKSGIKAPVSDGDPATESRGMLRRKEISGPEVSSGILESPAFGKDRPAESGGVTLEYTDGLKGKHITVDGWSWSPWTQAGVPWALNLDIQADDQGRITQVMIEKSAADAALNDAVIQNLYQRGKVLPAGACRGRIGIVFPGTP